MIDIIVNLAGLVYTIGKDVWTYVQDQKDKDKYVEKDRLVENKYLEDSGLKAAWEKEGYQLRWTVPKKVETRKLQGYEILYGVDDKQKEIFSLKLMDGSILMGKKENEEKTG